MRQISKTLLKAEDKSSSIAIDYKLDNTKNSEAKDTIKLKLLSSGTIAPSKQSSSSSSVNKQQQRPAWALTEQIAEKQSEDKDINDEDDLLSFVEGLDYKKCIDDIEIQTIMKRLKSRIVELEKEVAQDTMREEDAEVRAKKREMLTMMVSIKRNFTCIDIFFLQIITFSFLYYYVYKFLHCTNITCFILQ